MAEFEEKLNSILGNQEAMGQIMALARSLSAPPEPGETPPAGEEGQTASPTPEIPDLSQVLGGLDPGILQLGTRLLREYQGNEDRNAALLAALRPFLREERRVKLDRAIQLARMTRLIRAALGALGEKGGGEDV